MLENYYQLYFYLFIFSVIQCFVIFICIYFPSCIDPICILVLRLIQKYFSITFGRQTYSKRNWHFIKPQAVSRNIKLRVQKYSQRNSILFSVSRDYFLYYQ